MPFKRIASKLGVSVATAHAWAKDIEITAEQLHRNLYGPRGPQNPDHIARRAAAVAATHRQRRREYQADGRRRAREGDPLHMAGCMLYWAEGSKERNGLIFCNSDRHMVRFMRGFLTTCFGLEPDRFTVRLNVYTSNGISLREIEDHWLWELGLPRSCLRAHCLNHFPTSSSGKKRKKLPYGVCTLRVRKATHIVQHIYGAIQEYGHFEEPRWLDGPKKTYKPRSARRQPESAE
jgi:hypothetical protein